jgi:hypothetical protein
MSFLVRKINQAKWYQINVASSDDASADAITNDLKTTNNSLSVWQINSESELTEAILAIAAKLEHLETIDVVLFSSDLLNEMKLETVNSPGITPVVDLQDKHVDITNLNHSKLGLISKAIIAALKGSKTHRFTKVQLKLILKKAIDDDRVKAELLNEGISKKLF